MARENEQTENQQAPFPRRVSFEFGGDVFNVEYDMRIACDRYAKALQEVNSAEDAWLKMHVLVDWLVACIISWDIPESRKDSAIMPIAVESFRKLPLGFFDGIIKVITKDIDNFAS